MGCYPRHVVIQVLRRGSYRRTQGSKPGRNIPPVRLIYTDEAGVGANEPDTVVVGVIVSADAQWRRAAAAVLELLSTVPEPYRAGFISHASSVFHDEHLREHWSFDARLAFLHGMMSIPARLGLGVAWGLSRRRLKIELMPGHTLEQAQHAFAFQNCLAQADRVIRIFAHPAEVTVVVAEDSPDMRPFLRHVAGLLSARPLTIPIEHVRSSLDEHGVETRRAVEYSIERMIDTIHFAAKNQAILLQIADACAYGLRRYFMSKPFAAEFARSIAGRDPQEAFGGPAPDSPWASGAFPILASPP